MNNKENYKKALDQIHASEELKEKTIKKIQASRNKKKIVYLKYLSACAVFVLAVTSGYLYYGKNNILPVNPDNTEPQQTHTQIVASNKDLPRFSSMEELESVLEENVYFATNGLMNDIAILESATTDATVKAEATTKDLQSNRTDADYSKTNTQVQNVDEADIVKTDGEYIYYITNNIAYIVKADGLDIVSKINIQNDKERFAAQELYINENKLVVIGNFYSYETRTNETGDLYVDRVYTTTLTQAIVFDITDKTNPQEIRTVRLDGNYTNSRMIGDNVYLISSKYCDRYMAREDILPITMDTKTGERTIEATEIVYFKDTTSYQFMTVAGFDINNENAVCSETFFGASNNVYASENNLYITQIVYENGLFGLDNKNIIYKFKLDGSKIELLCKGEVNGYLNDQFSMDEYEGNLRIATTAYDEESTNQLYILDENLQELARLENLARGEKIYSVRFIGKVGYIVTFKQIDPLFVIDLSNPRNPIVKGELKIPGYSSYLHPYDETHIIGIGYNTKSNGFGGVTNANMKMSMFDVSDLENPIELFHVDIGERDAYSEITSNHKALFEHKGKDLIGFPVTVRDYNASRDRNTFQIFHVDLEKGFERYGEISQKIDYRTNIKRAIYIGDTLYTLGTYEIKSYTLDTLEEVDTLEIKDMELIMYNQTKSMETIE